VRANRQRTRAYIAGRLAPTWPDYAAGPDFIAELIVDHRDLWVMLFRVDHDLDALKLDDPRFANLL
jgi:hypothetical protein